MVGNPFAFGRDLWDPSHRFETSWLLPPYVLGAIRLLFGIYGITVLITQLAYLCVHPTTAGAPTCTDANDEFSYFTVLTYWGLACYNLVAGVHTLYYAHNGTRAPLDSFPRPLQALHSFLYSTITSYPFLVTIVYWGVIYPGHWFATPFLGFTNVSQHAMNSAFALFEILVPRTAAPPLIHIVFIVLVLALYLALAFVTYYTKHFWVYGFLDTTKHSGGYVGGFIVGIAVAGAVVFLIVNAVIRLRIWLTEKVLHKEGKFAHGRRQEDMEMTTSGQKGYGNAGNGHY